MERISRERFIRVGAALGVSAVVLTALFAIFNFLQYGTTAQVGRASGAGQEEAARRLGAQALWLCLGAGVVLAAAVAVLAPRIVAAMGAEGEAAGYAESYMRIVAIGLPSAFVALGAQGYLRGVADLRTPLLIVVAANVVNALLEVLFVYGFGWGIEGSAWGTVIAQAGMGAAFIVVILRAAGGDTRPARALMRRLLVIGRHIFVRTTALLSAFTLAGAVIARFGDASLAAHQIAFQLWIFLAFALDAIAIAAQAITGRHLGAGDLEVTRRATDRMVTWGWRSGLVTGALLALSAPLVGPLFTSAPAVHAALWPVLVVAALFQPLSGVVFVLDGVLIGAGDGRYLAWAGTVVLLLFAPVGWAVTTMTSTGLLGLWVAFGVAFMGGRGAVLLHRARGTGWMVTGAPARL